MFDGRIGFSRAFATGSIFRIREKNFAKPSRVRPDAQELAFKSFTFKNRIVQALQLLSERGTNAVTLTLGTDRYVVRLATTTGEREES